MKNLILMLAILFIGVVSAQDESCVGYIDWDVDNSDVIDANETGLKGTLNGNTLSLSTVLISGSGNVISINPGSPVDYQVTDVLAQEWLAEFCPPVTTTPTPTTDGVYGYYELIAGRDIQATRSLDYIEIRRDHVRFIDCDGEVVRHDITITGEQGIQIGRVGIVPFVTTSAVRNVDAVGFQFLEDGILNVGIRLNNNGGFGNTGYQLISGTPDCASAVVAPDPIPTDTVTPTTDVATPTADLRTGDTYASYYSDIDFDDVGNLQQYVDAFLYDAAAAGVSIERFTAANANIMLVNGLASNVNAGALLPCGEGYYIKINRDNWLSFGESNAGTLPNYKEGQRLRLIYHELGHALLQLDHTCSNSAIRRLMAGGSMESGNPDIGKSGSQCNADQSAYVADVLAASGGTSNNQWTLPAMRVRVADLFATSSDYRLECGVTGLTGKGSYTIYN